MVWCGGTGPEGDAVVIDRVVGLGAATGNGIGNLSCSVCVGAAHGFEEWERFRAVLLPSINGGGEDVRRRF
jgi:hypothetical protein